MKSNINIADLKSKSNKIDVDSFKNHIDSIKKPKVKTPTAKKVVPKVEEQPKKEDKKKVAKSVEVKKSTKNKKAISKLNLDELCTKKTRRNISVSQEAFDVLNDFCDNGEVKYNRKDVISLLITKYLG